MSGLAPYRVEWRPSYVTNWGAPKGVYGHEAALEEAEKMAERHGGMCRVITQHVIHTTKMKECPR